MDTEKLWWQKFGGYAEQFERVCPDYRSLDDKCRIIGALFKLELDMYNGGFLQFFGNWGYPAYLAAVEGLRQIGADTAATLVAQCYAVIEPYQDASFGLTSLADLPQLLTEAEGRLLDELDEQYWEDADRVTERMLARFED